MKNLSLDNTYIIEIDYEGIEGITNSAGVAEKFRQESGIKVMSVRQYLDRFHEFTENNSNWDDV